MLVVEAGVEVVVVIIVNQRYQYLWYVVGR